VTVISGRYVLDTLP